MTWSNIPLGSFAKVGSGQSAPQSREDFSDHGEPFIRAGSLEKLCSGDYYNLLEKITPKVAEKRRLTLFQKGTIVFAKSGMSATMGRIHILKQPCYVVSHLATINVRNETLAKFLFQYFRFFSPSHLIRDFAYPSIRLSDIENWNIQLPPEKVQARIVALLEILDKAKEQRKKVSDSLNELLHSAFISNFGDPATNPFGFPTVTIGDLLDSANYGTSSKARELGGWPILRMGNITYNGDWDFSSLKYIDLASKDETKYLVKYGDILFNRTNSKELVGKTAVYREEKPMAFAGYLIRARTNDEADPEYISAYLNSKHGKKILFSMCRSIVGMANINAQELKSIPILNPPIELQRKFAKKVRAILELKKKIIEASKLDEELFLSVQQRAFKGELDLSKIKIDELVNEDLEQNFEEPKETEPVGRYNRDGPFVAPPDIESELMRMEEKLDYGLGDSIPWSEKYFLYRTISQVLPEKFSFEQLWDATYYDMEDLDYEVIKSTLFKYVKRGLLIQEFDEKKQSIVFSKNSNANISEVIAYETN